MPPAMPIPFWPGFAGGGGACCCAWQVPGIENTAIKAPQTTPRNRKDTEPPPVEVYRIDASEGRGKRASDDSKVCLPVTRFAQHADRSTRCPRWSKAVCARVP